MKTVIIVHLLPHEIDWFEWQCKQLKIGSYLLDSIDEVIFDITLNLNLVKWGYSTMQREFFINKLRNCIKILESFTVNFEISEKGECLGIDDARRQSIRDERYRGADNFIYLDADLIFRPDTLYYIIESAKWVEQDYYIISPQVTKLWDHTWDVLGNEKYKDKSYGFEKIQDPYEVVFSNLDEGTELIEIPTFKFGGGWFNLISAELLWKTDIPDSFGPYGIDDTYVMGCCDILKQEGFEVSQYVMKNIIVAENYKYRDNPYTEHLEIIDRKDEYRNIAQTNMGLELRKFAGRI